MNRINILAQINFFYKNIFGNNININSFTDRIKLQKLVYILKTENIDFGYDFTWYIRGPYSSDLAHDAFSLLKTTDHTSKYTETNHDRIVLERLTRVRHIINDSNNAELVASYLFLQPYYNNNTASELVTRKPRFNEAQIHQVMDDWYRATNSQLPNQQASLC